MKNLWKFEKSMKVWFSKQWFGICLYENYIKIIHWKELF